MLSNEEIAKILADETLTVTQVYEFLIADPVENLVTADTLLKSEPVLAYVEEMFKEQIFPYIQQLRKQK